MSLTRYQAKRRFSETPEPEGAKKPSASGKLEFVVQEHHASHLHYDFRLELDGVLKSWAIPKGPSMDPHQKHLAVIVEDHPYEYRKFEGTIPEGNYGAGTVKIWDSGTYGPIGNPADTQAELRKGLKKGHITFIMHGKKLKGEFALVRFGDSKKNWLLIKKDDSFAASSTDPPSPRGGPKNRLRIHERFLGNGGRVDRPAIQEYPQIKPHAITPMLCTLMAEPFNDDAWLFEIKWDGYRAITEKTGSNVKLYSRAGNSFLEKFPQIAQAVRKIGYDVILDGEIIASDSQGHPKFEWLQNYGREPRGNLQYCVFDIIWIDGHDIRKMPLIKRKEILKSILPKKSLLVYSDDVFGTGKAFFKQVAKSQLEGMVAKRADSEYQEGVRGNNWLKIKTHLRQEFVIGGFTEPRGSRKFLGSLIVGVYKNGELTYTGHSGGGIPDKLRQELRARLDKIERKTSPFSAELPKTGTQEHWVQPRLVCEMSFSEWTREGIMRQPKFEGIREDKNPQSITREDPTN